MSDGDEVLKLERRLLSPRVRRDADALRALVAPEFVEIGTSGRVYDRNQMIETLAAEPDANWSISDADVRTIGDGLALVVYRASKQTRTECVQSVRSSIWKRDDNGWTLVFHQGTPVR